MMTFYSSRVKRLMDSIPGQQRFGLYRFLPIFFVLGAALEFSMIKWTVGETNFYSVYKRKQARKIAELQLKQEELGNYQSAT